MTKREKILEKVRRLRALANDKAGNVNEVASATKRMIELMLKYRIEEAELRTEVRADGYCQSQLSPLLQPWIKLLVPVLSYVNGVTPFFLKGKGPAKGAYIYGEAQNVEMAAAIFDYVLGQMKRLWKLEPRRATLKRDSYFTGMACTVAVRMRNDYDEMMAAIARQQTGSQTQALVVVAGQSDKAYESLQQMMGEEGMRSRPLTSAAIVNSAGRDLDAFRIGQVRGHSIELKNQRKLETAEHV